MKNIILCVSILLVSVTGNSQNGGIIVYEEKIKLQIQIDGATEEMLASIPKERTSEMKLVYTPEASYYSSPSEEPESTEMGNEEGGVFIQMDAPFYACYHDIAKGKVYEQREFMTRMFLVESNASDFKWKLTGNQKTILGYPCNEAILVDDTTQSVVAWFTPAIAVSTGPMMFSNLPGMILEAVRNEGETTWTATSIESQVVNKDELVKPKEGKKVSRAEFRQIVDEKMKEMEEQYGGNGNVIIQIEDDRQ